MQLTFLLHFIFNVVYCLLTFLFFYLEKIALYKNEQCSINKQNIYILYLCSNIYFSGTTPDLARYFIIKLHYVFLSRCQWNEAGRLVWRRKIINIFVGPTFAPKATLHIDDLLFESSLNHFVFKKPKCF